ncbi:hypothetical protein EDEG_01470 [Edhazardia aedis USNM 41457]|uniref:Protein-S-isoprenylcysteine O-methyltransferase n=1 Tax=Edhazardia aedis (strain USNM 41457) TaxID=1003232 RepID=J9D910_EDHAE|nr:hypothetical protein EDEG_01470 [Edhazardia aedis USNM 41457]|eukprot:EJW04256.1 hypothetical protein EDEG_01470 [Edhazardia aedis USNM 41457]
MIMIDHFLLGALFSLGIVYDSKHPFMHVISFVSLIYYCLAKFDLKRKEVVSYLLDIHKVLIIVGIVGLESFLAFYFLPFLRCEMLSRIGGIVMIFGIVFAIITLYYTHTKEGPVIMTGPYKYMRVPFYFGIILFILGSCLYMGTYCTLIYFYCHHKKEFMLLNKKEETKIANEDQRYTKYMSTVNLFGI